MTAHLGFGCSADPSDAETDVSDGPALSGPTSTGGTSTGGTSTGGTSTGGTSTGGTSTGGTAPPANTTPPSGTDSTPPANTAPPSGTGSTPPANATPPPASGSSPAPASDDEFDALRQVCVDRINTYRATLSLPALKREIPEIEACSDQGAKQDAESNRPHSSSGMCFELPTYLGGGQNTCPSLPVGGFGNATLESSLVRCIDQMWAEGPPPAPTTIEQCINDYSGCFPQHGHWINMIQTMYTSVSCGFYRKADGSYWGNQDFPIQR